MLPIIWQQTASPNLLPICCQFFIRRPSSLYGSGSCSSRETKFSEGVAQPIPSDYRTIPKHNVTHRPNFKQQVLQLLHRCIKINGKRQRRFFATEKEAKLELRKLEIQVRREGEQGFSVPEETRVLAAKATKLLEPFGGNLLDAAKFYVAHLESLATDVRVSALVDEYQETKRKAQFSAAYLDDIRQRLRAFNELFGMRKVKSLKSGEIEEWLHGLGLALQTVINYRAVLHGFFAFSIRARLPRKKSCFRRSIRSD